MSPQGDAQTILIVDDTPANLGVVVDYLEGHGFRVLVAQDGEEGLKRAQFVRPDLILLDVMMPGMDGFETCRRLKANDATRDIPVIFMTALADTGDKLTGFGAGGVDYVIKPFQIAEVLARVNTHLALRALRQQLAAQNARLQEEIAVREKTEAALQQAHDGLEERVAQRTTELAESNASLRAEITERKQAEERIRYMAHHDALTGLPNRALLEDRVGQAIVQARRSHHMVGVLFIDLDRFKHINDSLGHHIGDVLLQMAAERLQHCLRDGDSVARLGGDEYVIALPALANSNDAALVATKALEALDENFIVEGHELQVGGSIGISLYPADGEDAEALMRAADTAMYHAKEKGRGNFQFFTPLLNAAAQRRLALANHLRQTLERGEFTLHYQPQVDMETGLIFSAEALIRWKQPEAGPISPAEFVEIAEDTGLILPIGEWALRQACAQLRRWRDAGHPDLRIAVNLSARQFYQHRFEDLVATILTESGLPASALELEITESILMQPSEDNIATLKQLSATGVHLSVDDFGTGYSSLAYLQRFPVHALKIDRSFVSGIGHDPNDMAIVIAIIAMAHSLRLKVIAEGVENAEQVSFLRTHGCLAAQGFYYSAAVAPETFAELLGTKAARTFSA